MRISVEYGEQHALGRSVFLIREDGMRVAVTDSERYLAHVRMLSRMTLDARVGFYRTCIASRVLEPDLRACLEADLHVFAGPLLELERHAIALAGSPSGTPEQRRGLAILHLLQQVRCRFFGTRIVRGRRAPGVLSKKVAEAAEYLKTALADGPRLSSEIKANANSIAWPTLRRAAEALRVQKSVGRRSMWRLPKVAQPAQGRIDSVATASDHRLAP